HKTSYDYTDSWGNSSCTPSGQAKVFATTITNALGQTVTKSYNSCTATLASATDANLQQTTYSYDLVNRLKSVIHPDGGSTTNDYEDTKLIVTSSSLITSTGSPVFSRRHHDQLARVVQTELCEDGTADCATSIKTDTGYAEVGQTRTISNPYRPTTASTYEITTSQYDGLGRVTQVTHQDGGVSTTDYTKFPTVTVTDPAGKQRRSTTDALGQLIEVDEPGGGHAATGGTGSATTSGNEQSIGGASGTSGGGSATVNGNEQSIPGSPPTAGRRSVTISGLERSVSCGRSRCFDFGGVQITVNGFSKTVNYGQGSTTLSVALGFLTAFNNDTNSPVTVSVTNNIVTLT